MKEDLIVIPEIEVFKNLVNDARNDLAEIEVAEDDQEMKDRRDLALDVIGIIDEKLQATKDLEASPFKEKIWFAAHLYLLETVLEDLFEDEDDMLFFDEEEEGEEEEEGKK